jgi:hypothetical protein
MNARLEGRAQSHLWHVCKVTGYDYEVALIEVRDLRRAHSNLTLAGAIEHIIGGIWTRWERT